VLNIIYVFNSFPIIYTITKGAPANKTGTMVTYLYMLASTISEGPRDRPFRDRVRDSVRRRRPVYDVSMRRRSCDDEEADERSP
jgi:hypothetical protein